MPIATRREFVKKSTQCCIGAGLLASAGAVITGCSRRPYDLLIVNGNLYDGSGGAPVRADIGIRGDRIAAVGRLDDEGCPQVIDAKGLAVSPGFVDVHTHTDLHLLAEPRAESKIHQGVTLEIGGNCGDSVFPLTSTGRREVQEEWRREYGIEAGWSDLAGFFEVLGKKGSALNYATLIGHSTIRSVAMGAADRPPAGAELEAMKGHLLCALEQGALGLSTGLEYTPGAFAATDEIIALCREVARHGKVYATHMRNEDLTVEEALEETLRIGRDSGVSVQISHFKTCQQRNWHKTPKLLAAVEAARREGMNVHADRYPYTAYATSLKMLFPLWAREGGNPAFVARLKDPRGFADMAPFVRDKIAATGSWASIMITQAWLSGRRDYQGKTVEELATAAGEDPLDFTRRLLIEEEGQVGMCGFSMSEEDTRATFAAPYTMVGSDGNAISPSGLLGRGTPHPRYYGTFPRYLGYYVHEKKVLPLAEAIHRITALPCEKFSIRERGLIREGCFADIVLFDPATVIDRATFVQPHQFPTGIDWVIVNGEIVVAEGEQTGKLPGRILRG
ncbi:MAG TPA: D-aminoacylase [bacterium]|nr:D-aminoacylase [bacterium]